MRKCRFFQRDAYISVDFDAKKTEIVKLQDAENESDPYAVLIDLGKDKGKKQIIFETPEIKELNSIKEELTTFYQSIQLNTQPQVTVDDGYSSLQLAYRIIEKIKETSGLMI